MHADEGVLRQLRLEFAQGEIDEVLVLERVRVRGLVLRREEHDLVDRQEHRPPAFPNGDLAEVGLRRGLCLLALPAASGQTFDPCRELHDVERLGDVLLYALLEREDLREVLRLAGEHDHGELGGRRIVPDLHQRHPAVDPRHHDVEHDDVHPLASEQLDALGAVLRAQHVHAVGLETQADHLDYRLVIVDDEHADRLFSHRLLHTLRRIAR